VRFFSDLKKNPSRSKEMNAMPVLKKVISFASILIRPPRIPVNPQMSTIKCKMN
jgi:hypothetical protein